MSTRYPIALILLHWLIFPLMLSAFILGEVMEDLPRGDIRISEMGWHILAGLAMAALLLPRIAIRLRGVPPLPAATPVLELWLARLAHLGLYAVMLVLPITGLASILAGKRTVSVLGLFDLPSLTSLPWLHEAAEAIHEGAAKVFLLLLALHVAAAFWHALIRRDGVFRRILP
ncbi:MAG: cytochrome b [Ferrovibrio sp.]|uniref:cytochrome b n=1 Tax=Ferrovibrio sp. TaxID=1917215 RepID=UPI00391DD12A